LLAHPIESSKHRCFVAPGRFQTCQYFDAKIGGMCPFLSELP
jgi:hypothetical protein